MQPTSLSAKRSFDLSGDKIDHHRRILASLEFLKEGTFQEIANVCCLTYNQVGRRVSELVKENKVKDSGHFGISPSGKKAIKWELVKDAA